MNTFREVLTGGVKRLRDRRRFLSNVEKVRTLAEATPGKELLIVDCGFNKGVVAAELLRRLPKASLVGFEVQQDLSKDADRVKRRFPGRVEVIYAAVASRNGTINYFEPKAWGRNYKGGTTTLKAKASLHASYNAPKVAPCVDFSEWLNGARTGRSFVFIKMDIEGAEYEVLEHMLGTGTLGLVDVLAVEWHAHKLPEPERSRCLAFEQRLRAHIEQVGRPILLDWY
jgi:FkbM family methyltransferase